ncbi:MAG: C39 family peptidase [Chloroflexi bacterium]|nr:C39 family peptidase [Chloroflexota bacterium]
MAHVDVRITSGNGLSRSVSTDDSGAFAFDGLADGTYRVTLTVPSDYVATTDQGQDIEVAQGTDTAAVLFGLISMQAAGLNPDGTPAADPNSDDEQIIALASVTSLPLRFAEGRDLMAQVQRRVLGDGLVWLGVPFRSQIDGGDFQYVNCGPASLTMVLAGFGLDVGPSQVRDYLNSLIDNFNTDLGTSLDSLSRIGKDAGLTPMDLYSDGGGYRNWSTDAVRWHLQQGHPVITLVKYRNLPGHTKSLSEFDHYIVISGLTPNGFIYNDAAFATTLGYGLEISDIELEYAWDNSSIPHHALAMGLAPDKKALSFPELPRAPRPAADVAPARGARRLAEADEAERAPLTLTPVLPVVVPTGPLVAGGDQWETDPTFDLRPLDESGVPMGLNLETSEQPTLEPRPGPGTQVPKLLTLVGSAWVLWLVWSTSGRFVRWRPRLIVLRRRLSRH